MDNIGQIFYSVILPVLVTGGFGLLMWVLKNRISSSTTVSEFQALFNEVQEERKQLKENLVKMEEYKKDCNERIEEYHNKMLLVMDDEMEKRRKLERENSSLKSLVNTLTEKLSIAQDQLQQAQEKLELANNRIELLEQKLAKIEEKELEEDANKDTDRP